MARPSRPGVAGHTLVGMTTDGSDRRARTGLLPWPGAIGVGVLLLGLFSLAAGSPTGLLIVLIGVVLLCTGLVMRSNARRRDEF